MQSLEELSTLICMIQEGRRELVLTGKGVEERVQKNGIDLKIFSLKPLNFLEVVLPFQGFLYMMVESI